MESDLVERWDALRVRDDSCARWDLFRMVNGARHFTLGSNRFVEDSPQTIQVWNFNNADPSILRLRAAMDCWFPLVLGCSSQD